MKPEVITSLQCNAGVDETYAGVTIGAVTVTVRVPGWDRVQALRALEHQLAQAAMAVRNERETMGTLK